MPDNDDTPEWVSFFQAMEHSQRTREDRIYRHVRPPLESGALPTPDDVRESINSLVGERRQKLLRYHKFWREHKLRKGLDSLVHSAHQASIDVSRHDAALGALADSASYQDKVDFAVGHALQKDVVAYCALALGVRDTLKKIRNFRCDISDEISEAGKRVYCTDISQFVRNLRNNLLHGDVLIPQWNVSFDGNRRTTTGSMRYSVDDLKASGKWNEQARRYMQSSTDEHLHLSVVVRDHFGLINELKAKLDALFAQNISESEWDYCQIQDSHERRLRRQWMKVLIGQIWNGKNPYGQLYRFFEPEVLREILRYPRHSKEQVDFIIAMKSSEIDCDDELRQMLYRAFRVVPGS